MENSRKPHYRVDAGETTAGRLEERMYEDFLRGETVIKACSLPPTP